MRPGSLILLLAALLPVTALSADAPIDTAAIDVAVIDVEAVNFFERKIRPVLIERCYSCHSDEARADGKLKGGLLLDSRQASAAGGDSGPAVVPGKPDESLLIDAIRYGEDSFQMPPAGKLPDKVIADFEKWIATGAADPRDMDTTETTRKVIDWEKARKHWSLQPPQRHQPPAVENQARNRDWIRSPIDAFILSKAEQAGLTMAPQASRQTLLRRACFDLCGLPPTLQQQSQFLGDDSPDAFAKLVDRLLNSQQYGERWARHWLDVARYSEDNTNMGPHNGPYPHAWRYRDWVVKAFNKDVPYDEFIVRQLATDFLPDTGPEDHAALGFQGLAPSYHKEVALAKLVLENRYADEWEDRVDAIGRGLLGMTLACARCHDHKYDPITVKDYYALAGVFASCRQTTRPIISDEEVARTQPARDRVAELEGKVAEWTKQQTELSKEVAELTKKLKESKSAGQEDKPGFDPAAAEKRIAEVQALIETAKLETPKAKSEIARLKKTPGFEVPVANALTEEQVRVEEINKERMKIVYYAKPRDLNIFIRGDAGRLGPLVQRRFLQVLSDGEMVPFQNGSGRLELAQAIVAPDNPLTARVIVNRVWMHHFGVGLVDTPSNFGVTGSTPSHPQLLDDLSVRFVENGWSLKWLHREILNSATWQQSSTPVAAAAYKDIDPDNRLLTFFNRRRLDAEAFRDAILATTGQLDTTTGGPSGDADQPEFKRRMLYASVSRHKLSGTLQTFDFPDPAIHCAKRSETTTPLQQMFVLNSPFMKEQSASLAARVKTAGGSTLVDRVEFAHRLVFGREATEAELEIAQLFLSEVETVVEAPKLVDGEPPEFKGSRIQAFVKTLGDNYTVEVWLRNSLAHKTRPVTGYFFSRALDQPADDHGDHFGISGTASPTPGRLLFYNGIPHRQSITGRTTLNLNAWHHVAFRRSGEAVSIFLDGTLDGAADIKPGYKSGSEQIYVGGRRDNFANFLGQLQEAAIYDRCLSDDEIAAHFRASGLPAAEHSHAACRVEILKSQPLAYWPLRIDPPESAIAVDLSGHDNHGRYEDRTGKDGKVSPWQRYAHALLSSNEFFYID